MHLYMYTFCRLEIQRVARIHVGHVLQYGIRIAMYKINKFTNVNPAKTSINVDFPAPDSPIIAVSSPALNSPLTFFNSSDFSETDVRVDTF